jgi:nucleolar complex protein 3
MKPKRKNEKKKWQIQPAKKVLLEKQTMNKDMEESSLDEEDYAFLDEYGPFSTFLNDLDDVIKTPFMSKDKKHRKKTIQSQELTSTIESKAVTSDTDSCDEKELSDRSNLETTYERRLQDKREPVKENPKNLRRLPIKTPQGSVILIPSSMANEITSETDSEIEHSVKNNDEIPYEKENMSSKLERDRSGTVENNISFDNRMKYLRTIKNEIAGISQKIIENPETYITSMKLLQKWTVDPHKTVQKMALLSLLAIFKDILPGYRIRLPTETENHIKLSKETHALRFYERQLLMSYQHYLKILEALIKNKKQDMRARRKGHVVHKKSIQKSHETLLIAIKCLCELLISASHFNFNVNLITILVPKMNMVFPPQVSLWTHQAISHIVEHDQSGDLSLFVVRCIAKFITSKNYQTRPEILRVFTKLKFLDDMEIMKSGTKIEGQKRKKEMHYIPKKQRKLLKKEKEAEREKKEVEVEFSQREKSKKVNLP